LPLDLEGREREKRGTKSLTSKKEKENRGRKRMNSRNKSDNQRREGTRRQKSKDIRRLIKITSVPSSVRHRGKGTAPETEKTSSIRTKKPRISTTTTDEVRIYIEYCLHNFGRALSGGDEERQETGTGGEEKDPKAIAVGNFWDAACGGGGGPGSCLFAIW